MNSFWCAQGIFFNAFFLTYLIAPTVCHKFVGYLEEEAVKTYTHALHDIDSGRLPAWTNMPAPDIAKRYWKMDVSNACFCIFWYLRMYQANGYSFLTYGWCFLGQCNDAGLDC